MAYETTQNAFLLDVQDHKMKILLDSGVYRHIRFTKDNSIDMYFDLITGPGYLLYRGDMGCYEFERLTDMFDFFFKKSQPDTININPGYWGEKLQACCIQSNYKIFDNDLFQKQLKEIQNDFIEDLDEEEKQEFIEACEWHFSSDYDNEYYAHMDTSEFNHEDKNPFQDMFIESSPEIYSSHYIWACYAIAWGIEQYRNYTTTKEATV